MSIHRLRHGILASRLRAEGAAPSAPVVVSTTSANSGSSDTSSQSITLPGTRQNGDIILIFPNHRTDVDEGANGGLNTWLSITGFTLLDHGVDGDDATIDTPVFYRVVNGSEGSSVNVVNSDDNGLMSVVAVLVRGGTIVGMQADHNSLHSDGTTTITAPSLTAAGPALSLVSFRRRGNTSFSSITASLTELEDEATGGSGGDPTRTMLLYRTVSAGATGTYSANQDVFAGQACGSHVLIEAA